MPTGRWYGFLGGGNRRSRREGGVRNRTEGGRDGREEREWAVRHFFEQFSASR